MAVDQINEKPSMSANRQGISLRIGRSAAELSRPCFTAGTSRVARSRATKAMQGLRKRKAVSPQSPPSPNQESAMNSRTGKVAFGPWLGPYETHNDAAATEPLFLDRDGNTYASLSGIAGLNSDAETPKPAPTNSPATATTQQLYALVNKVAAAQARAQARQPAQWLSRGKPHGSGRCSGTMVRSINQPRRH